jgi:hypothetical protein
MREFDATVHELLRDADAGASITLVVFGHQFKFQRLACHGDLLGVEFFNGHAHTVLVVLAGKGVGAGERAAVANGDDLFFCVNVACEGECNENSGTGNGKFHQDSFRLNGAGYRANLVQMHFQCFY